jgi:hypothetical protein
MNYPATSTDSSPPTGPRLTTSTRRSLGIVSAAAMAGLGLLSGCGFLPSHVHNEGKAKIATAAQARMQQYSKNAPAMYTAMSANVDKFKIEEDYLLGELARNFHTALITKLPTLTWKAVAERADDGGKRVTKFHQRAGKEGQDLRKRIDLAQARSATAESQVAKAKTEVKAAREDISAWNAYIALLQQGFKNLPDNVKALDAGNGVATLKGLGEAAKAIGDKEIVFTDADGKEVRKKVSKIVMEQAQKIGADITGKNEKGQPLFPKAPGISLRIMNHALELAELELRKAETDLEQANERLELFQDALSETLVARQLFADVKKEAGARNPTEVPVQSIALVWRNAGITLDSFTSKKAPVDAPQAPQAPQPAQDQTPLPLRPLPLRPLPLESPQPGQNEVSPENLASALWGHENSVAEFAYILRRLAIAESILARNESLFSVKVARLEHQHSIAQSALADATYRSLIQAQLDGLVSYHQGGFTKEDAANIVRLAQSIALFAIANNTQ